MRVIKVAGVDIGTNSTRILIADVGPGRDALSLRTLHRIMTITRLGEGVDDRGFLDSKAVRRTAETLSEYRELMRREGVEAWEVAATSATRDAANSGEFIRIVGRIMGRETRVLSGDEEARLSFLGATYDLEEMRPRGTPIFVVDIGGGSTEVILGRDGHILYEHSLDMGCVRMSERFLTSDPPLREELEAMEAYVRSLLAPVVSRVSSRNPGLTVGLAGTVTTLSGLKQGLDRYDGDVVHHSWLTLEDVEALYADLYTLPLADRRRYMSLEPGRADVIVGGTGVLLVFMRESGCERLLVSEKDILDGLAISAARKGA
ncbi:MAG: Ppx/GppA phosphatase family protein [Actinomycetota bacterium]|nr:Ppx/GppA phosphatase family protein [Actinomycetota bacterium]